MTLTKENVFAGIRHNFFLFTSFLMVLVSLLWIYGCESTTQSLKQPGLQVNRAELMLELDTIISESHIRISDLDRQDQFKEAMFELALVYAEGGTINPVAIAMTLGSILGLGAVIDNRRKDVVIKTLKHNCPQ